MKHPPGPSISLNFVKLNFLSLYVVCNRLCPSVASSAAGSLSNAGSVIGSMAHVAENNPPMGLDEVEENMPPMPQQHPSYGAMKQGRINNNMVIYTAPVSVRSLTLMAIYTYYPGR